MEEESLNWHLGYLVLGLAQTWANNYEKTLPLGKIAENKIWKKPFFHTFILLDLIMGKS